MNTKRTYRLKHNKDYFVSFTIAYKDTDLWIGVKENKNLNEIKNFAYKKIIFYRKILETYIQKKPIFASTHKPIPIKSDMPLMAKQMTIAALYANTGPMAAVAGAFSEFIAKDIIKKFNIDEIMIENGGDIFLQSKKDITVSIFAGNSVLSDKIGIKIPADETPIGICTSAGSFGDSFSYGKADAAVVAAKSTLIADALATHFANNIISENDIDKNIKKIKNFNKILSLCLIKNNKIGIAGIFDLTFT
jgi:hypothetical protein